jgi:sigma-E factor negative regulatory protein RseB
MGMIFSVKADQSLWNLIWASKDQSKSLNYTGLLVSESGKHSQISKLTHHSNNSSEIEVLERLDGHLAKWIRRNDEIQCFIPEKKLIFIERRHTSVNFPKILSIDGSSLSLKSLYSISELPERRVAGRLVHALKLLPKDDLRYEYRLYLDRENKLLMRSELYSPNGEILEHIGFKEVSFESGPMDVSSLLKLPLGWQTSSTEVRILSDDELPYELPANLVGFQKTDTVCRTKSADQQIHQTVYSDGLSTVSVFIQEIQSGKSMPHGPMTHGAVMSKSSTQGKYMLTVLGEVPEKTLGLFLKSVRWKSQ